ncbi:hypothetical protein HELRODRAFT_178378 [Helobdella robusta]|uniref:Uncharacterized protein n=1 Tax=Helobdella robusta TaxID=6412 RepID=T1FD41_HELRO|nr:hypothetical protein HELRODRAFT_178378 [Helobdella robusta]ESN97255.1 hypothetical protein HELRODRAFT_178378 [Helobdella robusta]
MCIMMKDSQTKKHEQKHTQIQLNHTNLETTACPLTDVTQFYEFTDYQSNTLSSQPFVLDPETPTSEMILLHFSNATHTVDLVQLEFAVSNAANITMVLAMGVDITFQSSDLYAAFNDNTKSAVYISNGNFSFNNVDILFKLVTVGSQVIVDKLKILTCLTSVRPVF